MMLIKTLLRILFEFRDSENHNIDAKNIIISFVVPVKQKVIPSRSRVLQLQRQTMVFHDVKRACLVLRNFLGDTEFFRVQNIFRGNDVLHRKILHRNFF